MPNNKIYTILVLCAGIVISIWLIQRKPTNNIVAQNLDTVSVVSNQNNINAGTTTASDWQKILVNLDSKNQNFTNLVQNDTETTFDETTLTAQLAKDLFSQYLLVAKKEGGVTTDDANQIADNVLLTPDYTKTEGAIYIRSNLKINLKTDRDTVNIYHDTLTERLQNKSIKNPADPFLILKTALEKDDPNILFKLDPLILTFKLFVSVLLDIQVPNDAVKIHLDLLNSYNTLLSNLEAMRVVFTDPVRGLSGINQYQSHFQDLETAITNLRTYLKSKNINL